MQNQQDQFLQIRQQLAQVHNDLRNGYESFYLQYAQFKGLSQSDMQLVGKSFKQMTQQLNQAEQRVNISERKIEQNKIKLEETVKNIETFLTLSKYMQDQEKRSNYFQNQTTSFLKKANRQHQLLLQNQEVTIKAKIKQSLVQIRKLLFQSNKVVAELNKHITNVQSLNKIEVQNLYQKIDVTNTDVADNKQFLMQKLDSHYKQSIQRQKSNMNEIQKITKQLNKKIIESQKAVGNDLKLVYTAIGIMKNQYNRKFDQNKSSLKQELIKNSKNVGKSIDDIRAQFNKKLSENEAAIKNSKNVDKSIADKIDGDFKSLQQKLFIKQNQTRALLDNYIQISNTAVKSIKDEFNDKNNGVFKKMYQLSVKNAKHIDTTSNEWNNSFTERSKRVQDKFISLQKRLETKQKQNLKQINDQINKSNQYYKMGLQNIRKQNIADNQRLTSLQITTLVSTSNRISNLQQQQKFITQVNDTLINSAKAADTEIDKLKNKQTQIEELQNKNVSQFNDFLTQQRKLNSIVQNSFNEAKVKTQIEHVNSGKAMQQIKAIQTLSEVKYRNLRRDTNGLKSISQNLKAENNKNKSIIDRISNDIRKFERRYQNAMRIYDYQDNRISQMMLFLKDQLAQIDVFHHHQQELYKSLRSTQKASAHGNQVLQNLIAKAKDFERFVQTQLKINETQDKRIYETQKHVSKMVATGSQMIQQIDSINKNVNAMRSQLRAVGLELTKNQYQALMSNNAKYRYGIWAGGIEKPF